MSRGLTIYSSFEAELPYLAASSEAVMAFVSLLMVSTMSNQLSLSIKIVDFITYHHMLLPILCFCWLIQLMVNKEKFSHQSASLALESKR